MFPTGLEFKQYPLDVTSFILTSIQFELPGFILTFRPSFRAPMLQLKFPERPKWSKALCLQSFWMRWVPSSQTLFQEASVMQFGVELPGSF